MFIHVVLAQDGSELSNDDLLQIRNFAFDQKRILEFLMNSFTVRGQLPYDRSVPGAIAGDNHKISSTRDRLRTIAPIDLVQLPRFLRALLRRAQAMQLNLAELNDGRNPADRLITRDLSFKLDTPVSAIAATLRAYFGVSIEQQSQWASVDDALEQWREVLATAGIYVFKDAFHAEQHF